MVLGSGGGGGSRSSSVTIVQLRAAYRAGTVGGCVASQAVETAVVAAASVGGVCQDVVADRALLLADLGNESLLRGLRHLVEVVVMLSAGEFIWCVIPVEKAEIERAVCSLAVCAKRNIGNSRAGHSLRRSRHVRLMSQKFASREDDVI